MKSTTSPRLPYRPRFYGTPTPLKSIYTPAQKGSIRTIHIQGFDGDGLLGCSLRVRSFEEEPYTAISYTWNLDPSIWYDGPGKAGKPIKINGHVVTVRDKVVDILCLMYHLEKYIIWIDGLCTNQEDDDDKAIQVKQMGSVYRLADSVMTVLDSPTAETDFLLDRQNWTSEIISSERNRMHKTMLTILANNYWRRAWILQEIALAQKIMLCCGQRVITYDDLSSLFSRLKSHQSLTQFASGAARMLGTLLKTDPSTNSAGHDGADGGNFDNRDLAMFSSAGRAEYQNIPFLDLLDKSRRFNRCFQPKDMLYARRSLASDGEALIPEVHYSPEWSVEDVYKDFAKRFVTTSSPPRLRILTYASWHTEGELPSWVPDWRMPESSWQAPFNRPGGDGRFHKLRWSKVAPTVSANGNELTAQGRILATITPDQRGLFVKEKSTVTNFVVEQLRNHSSYNIGGVFPNPPAPAVGDVICALKGCPAFVFLRAVEGSHKYRLVGKHRKFQRIAIQHCLTDTVLYEEDSSRGGDAGKKWSFRDMTAVNGIPEQSFTIV